MRVLPRSLFGQIMLAIALALLVAQAISAVLLWQSAQSRREVGALHAAAYRITASVDDPAMQERRDFRRDTERRRPWRDRFPRTFGVQSLDRLPGLAGADRQPKLERFFSEILDEQDAEAVDLAIYRRHLASDPFAQAIIERRARRGDLPRWAKGDLLFVAAKLEADGPWHIVRVPLPPPDTQALGTMLLQTLLIFILLLAIMAIMLRRITKPLGALTRQTERFAATGSSDGQIIPEGPTDIRRLITAHNAMEDRIGAMLNEKDVMLGAIGHDLKTPLAALRVRIESIADENQRARMAGTIEDITQTLDDILSLARVGRPSDAPEPTDLAALAASVVEEFEDMGEPASMTESPRTVLTVRPTWLRRALRNLVSNALRYGGNAEVSLLQHDGQTILRVDDNGPGIPADRIEEMLEPFRRGEQSRNRATGGAGLGLTLAKAIAEQHGGSLSLKNRPNGGLRAELRLPAAH